jgi:hypothetical protein
VVRRTLEGAEKHPKNIFSSKNLYSVGTAPSFLPNTMKIKLLIIHPALKLGVKPGREAISSKIECVSVNVSACGILSANVIQKDCYVEGKSWAYTRVLRRVNP